MINRVILMGRLGKDPEVKRLENGKIVAKLNLATNEIYQKDGVRHEVTEWHNLEMWDKQAEFAEKYLMKGRIIYIEGKIRTEKYIYAQGIDRQFKKIRVSSLQVIDVQGKDKIVTPSE